MKKKSVLSKKKVQFLIYFLVIMLFPDLYRYGQILPSKYRYEKEIEDYNANLEEYVSSLDLQGKNHTEIVMNVVEDMWDSIEGYKRPALDAFGYWRLDILNGYGVCRNMTDDITAKLNAINPKYNARNVAVYATITDWESANIDIKCSEEITFDPALQDMQKILGNHLVTLIDIPHKNITLVIDSTNGGLGVLKNGKIEMFNDPNSTFEINTRGVMYEGGYLELFDILLTIIKSYSCEENMTDLVVQYGVEAQNKALTVDIYK